MGHTGRFMLSNKWQMLFGNPSWIDMDRKVFSPAMAVFPPTTARGS